MTKEEILKKLKTCGNEGTKKIYIKHGAKEPFFGVKVADLKKILKKTKKNHELSLELYATGNSDAMYLAGLMADETKITAIELEEWADKAYWYMLSEYTVPWVAAETAFGFNLGLKWIASSEERIASAGWATLSYYAGVNPDEKLDISKYQTLLDIVEKDIHQAQNRVRYTMNGFVIATGMHIKTLTNKAMDSAVKIGKVQVSMGETACKVPLASTYLKKIIDKGKVGKKRKTARC